MVVYYAFNQEYNMKLFFFNVVMFYANGLYDFQYTVQKCEGEYLRKYS